MSDGGDPNKPLNLLGQGEDRQIEGNQHKVVVRGGQHSHEYNISYAAGGDAQIKEHPGEARDVARKVLEPWLQKVVRGKP